jgi:hypothetical protein
MAISTGRRGCEIGPRRFVKPYPVCKILRAPTPFRAASSEIWSIAYQAGSKVKKMPTRVNPASSDRILVLWRSVSFTRIWRNRLRILQRGCSRRPPRICASQSSERPHHEPRSFWLSADAASIRIERRRPSARRQHRNQGNNHPPAISAAKGGPELSAQREGWARTFRKSASSTLSEVPPILASKYS